MNEKIIQRTADAMVSEGLLAAGYEYLSLDDWYSACLAGACCNLCFFLAVGKSQEMMLIIELWLTPRLFLQGLLHLATMCTQRQALAAVALLAVFQSCFCC